MKSPDAMKQHVAATNRRPDTRPSRGRPLRIDRPEPGTYRTRLWSKGPWVPAIIFERPSRDPVTGQKMDRAPTLMCVVGGQEVDVYQYWTRLHPISEQDYMRLCKERGGIVDSDDINSSKVRI